ncbi:MAG: hypothetical protein ACRYF2_10740 [Janthinobacterium lividum]
MPRFDGKVVIVIGATSGISESAALCFAADWSPNSRSASRSAAARSLTTSLA